MDKKKTLATLAFCLSASHATQVRANQEVDLQTLKILNEEAVSYDEFAQDFRPAASASSGGNYSRFSISNGNYSRFSISNANYSRFSISNGNYSRFSISNSNYSRFSISGTPAAVNTSAQEIPAPIDAEVE